MTKRLDGRLGLQLDPQKPPPLAQLKAGISRFAPSAFPETEFSLALWRRRTADAS